MRNTFAKNTIRDIRNSWGAYLGASLIIVLGVFIYVGMIDTLHNLKGQLNIYYQDAHLADIFASVTAIPEEELQRITAIPGIEVAFGRLTKDVRVLSDRSREIITLHLMAYDEQDQLNRIQLRPDRMLDTETLYLGSKMRQAYDYQVGEPFQVLLNGDVIDFTIAGECYSPDYVYAIPPGGAKMADEEIYDIACIDKDYLQQLLGMEEQVNELAFKLKPGYTFENVRYQLIEQLEKYGLTSITERENQLSYRLVDGEMDSLVATGTLLPVIFMILSVFMLSIVLRKIIDRDRSLIGTAKAFGYRNWELITGYMWQGVGIGLIGGLIGSVFAESLGRMVFATYIQFYNLPNTSYQNYASTRAAAMVIAVCSSMYAVYSGVKGIVMVNPAESMRVAAPSLGVQLPFPQRIMTLLNPMQKMGIRSISRSPVRTAIIIFAIAFPFAMLSVLVSFPETANEMVRNQFDRVQTYNVLLSLDKYHSRIAAKEVGEQLDGVEESEAIVSVGVEFKNQNISEFDLLYGLNRNSSLYRIMDIGGGFYEPPNDGIIMNITLAEKLHISEGDTVEVTNVFLAPEPIKLKVKKIIEEPMGNGTYMDIEAIRHFFNAEAFSDTVLLRTEDENNLKIKNQLLETSNVTYIVDKNRVLKSYQNMMLNMINMTNIFSMMSVASGIILIYNVSLISIRERRTELGTLLILGTTEREFWQMIIFEQLVYFISGIVLGIPMSASFRIIIQKVIVTDTLRMRLKVLPIGYLVAFISCILIMVAVSIGIMRMIRKINGADILKER